MCLADERTRMNLNPDHQLKRFVDLETFFLYNRSEQDSLFQALDEDIDRNCGQGHDLDASPGAQLR